MARGRGTKARMASNASNLAEDEQPIREIPASDFYGQRKQLTQQQQAAPLPDRSGAPVPQPDPDAMARDILQGGSVFGATRNPGQPPTAGAARGPGVGPPEQVLASRPAEDILRAAYQQFPSESLRRLLEVTFGG